MISHHIPERNLSFQFVVGWMGYDDKITKSISIKDVVTDRAYVLVYKQRPQ